MKELIGVPPLVFKKLSLNWEKHLKESTSHSTSFKLSPRDQILQFFIHLRYYTSYLLLGHIFDASKSTSFDNMELLTEHFFNYFNLFVNWGTLEERLEHSFKYFNHHITFLIDGT